MSTVQHSISIYIPLDMRNELAPHERSEQLQHDRELLTQLYHRSPYITDSRILVPLLNMTQL